MQRSHTKPSTPETPATASAEAVAGKLAPALRRAGFADTAGLAEALGNLGLVELKRLFKLVQDQYAAAFSVRKKICLAGPVNTGKSSLYNALVSSSAPRAQVGPVPGLTRTSQIGESDLFWIVDTPGANEMEVGPEGPRAAAERHEEALASAQRADLLVIVFDASQGIAHDELKIYDELLSLGKPAVVALNKIDLVRKEREQVIAAAAENLQLPPDELIPISATRGINLNGLLLAVARTQPELVATLAELLPGSRWLLARQTILAASAAAGTANAITSAVAIPFASFVPITSIQVGMVLKLARVFGYELNAGRAKEILVTFGTGLLARTLFYELVSVVPVAGWALGSAIAVGTTMALGYSIATWFGYGERPSAEAIKRLSESLTRTLAARLKEHPDRRSLKKEIQQTVDEAYGTLEELAAGLAAEGTEVTGTPSRE